MSFRKENAKYISADEYAEKFASAWKKMDSRFFKYEGLQYYDIEGDDAWAAYLNKDFRTCEVKIKEQIAEQTEMYRQVLDESKSLIRIRFVEKPLNDYTHYEMLSYKVSAQYGEKIFILPDLSKIKKSKKLEDFVLFDEENLLVSDYDKDGKFKGAWIVTDEEDLATYLSLSNWMVKNGIILGEFLNDLE